MEPSRKRRNYLFSTVMKRNEKQTSFDRPLVKKVIIQVRSGQVKSLFQVRVVVLVGWVELDWLVVSLVGLR